MRAKDGIVSDLTALEKCAILRKNDFEEPWKMENELCRQLFDIANENMQQSGHAFTHPKAAFLYYTRNDPHMVDILELLKEDASNEEFVEIAYLAILNRPIDEEAQKHWLKQATLPEKRFRRLVIERLTSSPEADICHKRIYNNIYAVQRRKGTGTAGFFVQKLLPVYRRLPQGMKNGIRKVMGVGE